MLRLAIRTDTWDAFLGTFPSVHDLRHASMESASNIPATRARSSSGQSHLFIFSLSNYRVLQRHKHLRQYSCKIHYPDEIIQAINGIDMEVIDSLKTTHGLDDPVSSHGWPIFIPVPPLRWYKTGLCKHPSCPCSW